jgi:uncharacterized protein
VSEAPLVPVPLAPVPLAPVPLADLRLRDGGRRWSVDQAIAGLDTLTPVRGILRAEHHGNALEVVGRAETIVTLCCDRCLQHYNQTLGIDCRELIELGGARAAGSMGTASTTAIEETFVVGHDLDDRLDPRGSFDPERWLFEQLSLQLPLVNRCGADCPGPPAWSGASAESVDPRWAALTTLRHDPPQG